MTDIEFMTEEEQGDDPESIRRWIEDLDSISPVPIDPCSAAGGATDVAKR